MSEEKVQKHLVVFCKYLPKYVGIWSETLQKSSKCVECLCNYAEQLSNVERAQINYIDDFETIKNCLQFRILEGAEEQLVTLKGYMDILNQAVFELKNKLSTLERATLDSSNDSDLTRGSATQPELSHLLQHSLEFWMYFSGAVKQINKCYKEMSHISIRDEKYMAALEKSFKVDMNDKRVTYLLALTQYVDNHRPVV